jgi:ABC-type Fe3+ transport system permease subunit
MTATALVLALGLLASPGAAHARPVTGGSGSDPAPGPGALRDELALAGTVAAASGGVLMGVGLGLLGYHGVVLHEEVRVGLTREQTVDGQTLRAVTNLERYRQRRDEALLVWNGGWYSLSAGLVAALLGTGLGLSPQLFLTPARE